MRHKLCVSLALLVPLLAASIAFAQSGYDLGWFKVAGGGQASGGSYALWSTLGQAEAGTLAGGAYSLTGGLLNQGESGSAQHRLLLPLLLKGASAP